MQMEVLKCRPTTRHTLVTGILGEPPSLRYTWGALSPRLLRLQVCDAAALPAQHGAPARLQAALLRFRLLMNYTTDEGLLLSLLRARPPLSPPPLFGRHWVSATLSVLSTVQCGVHTRP